MSDPSFETQISRLFAQPQHLPDAAAFTAAVQGRLERGWALRRALIGTAGGVGGLVAAAQVVGANLVQRAADASRSADTRAHDVAGELVARGQAALHVVNLSMGGEVLWMVAGLAALGVALVAARLMESF